MSATREPRIKFPGKLIDIAKPGSTFEFSNVEAWWKKNGIRSILKTRVDAKISTTIKFWDPEYVISTFKLNGLQYGNWLSQEDRFNYLMSAGAGLHLLATKVMDIPAEKLGAGKLGLCFGSRGKPKSLGTFWPSLSLINVNRWKRKKGNRGLAYESAFLGANTIGCFAHEFGHWLDWHCGAGTSFQSGGVDVIMGIRQNKLAAGKGTCSYHMERIFETLFLFMGQPTPWVKDMMDADLKKYWYQRTEIFARYFEAMTSMILERQGIPSEILCNPDFYRGRVYPPTDLLKATESDFKAFCQAWAKGKF